MAMNFGKIAIVGCGPGSCEYLTDAARKAVAQADVLIGSQRLLEMFAEHRGERIAADGEVAKTLDAIDEEAAQGRCVAVLVSGDPGVFSLAALVVRRFGRERCEILAGISSVQVAFARLAMGWADARILSAHGRLPTVTAVELAEEDKIAIFAGTRDAVQWSAQIAAALRDTHALYLGEHLTLENERFRSRQPEELASCEPASLAIILLVRRTLLS